MCHDVIHNMLNNHPDMGRGYNTLWGRIDIKDNVFIGTNSTILPDVTIGPNAVIAAGSLVNKDVPEGKIVAGVPAKVVGDLSSLAEKRRVYSSLDFSEMNRDERLNYLWKDS